MAYPNLPDGLYHLFQPVASMVRNTILVENDAFTASDMKRLKGYIHQVDHVNDKYFNVRLLSYANPSASLTLRNRKTVTFERISAEQALSDRGFTQRQFDPEFEATLTERLNEVGYVDRVSDEKGVRLIFRFGERPKTRFHPAFYLSLASEAREKRFLHLPFKGEVVFYIGEIKTPDKEEPEEPTTLNKIDLESILFNRHVNDVI